MTLLSRRLLVRILFQRWLDKKPRPFKRISINWLNKILDESELDAKGTKFVLWRATADDKRRVIRDLEKEINSYLGVMAAL